MNSKPCLDSLPVHPPGSENAPQELHSSELFGNSRLVVIRHEGEAYRLLITKNNRLILQK